MPSGVFQSTFGPVAGKLFNSPVSADVPVRFNPRNCGQSEASVRPDRQRLRTNAFRHIVIAISPPAVVQIPEPSRTARDDAVVKKVARAFLTPRAKGSPSIPARPRPPKATGDFKGDKTFVPGLKPGRQHLSLASWMACNDRKPVIFCWKYIDMVVGRPDQYCRPVRVDCPTQRRAPCTPCTQFTRTPDSDTLPRADPVPADAIYRVRVARSVRSKSWRVLQCTVCSQLPC